MTGGFLSKYARWSMAPERRAAAFVLSEPRLTWTSLFYDDFPAAEIYLVGGTLRDVLLGRVPKDIDIVIRGVVPDGLEKWLHAHGAADFVGKRFGTFKFVPHGCSNREPIDIALPRTEAIGDNHASGSRDLTISSDYRLPIKEDLARRDFTINAMAFDLKFQRLIDPYLGLHDLEAQLIRAVRNAEDRFFEDATRMLRGLRFASELLFGIEQHTWEAIKSHLDLLENKSLDEGGTHKFAIPRAAIGKEFLLGFAAHPAHTLHLWNEAGALQTYMPEVARLTKILESDGESAFQKTLDALNLLKRPDFAYQHGLAQTSPTVLVAAMMAFVQETHAKTGFKICKSLFFHQFPQHHHANVNCKDVLWLLEHLYEFEQVDPANMRPSKFEKIFLNQRGKELLLLMHAVFIASKKHSIERERLHMARRLAQRMRDELTAKGIEHMPRLVHGAHIKELGLESGPVFRELLEQVRDAQWAHKIHTEEDAMNLLRELVRKL